MNDTYYKCLQTEGVFFYWLYFRWFTRIYYDWEYTTYVFTYDCVARGSRSMLVIFIKNYVYFTGNKIGTYMKVVSSFSENEKKINHFPILYWWWRLAHMVFFFHFIIRFMFFILTFYRSHDVTHIFLFPMLLQWNLINFTRSFLEIYMSRPRS